MRTNLTHSLSVETDAEAEGLFERAARLADEQAAAGWMLVRDHDVLNGSAATTQAYRYSDGAGRVERAIDTLDGAVLSDNVTESYSALGVAASTSAAACCRGRRRCPGIVAAKCSDDVAAM